MNTREAVYDTIEETVGDALWPYTNRLVHEDIFDHVSLNVGRPEIRVIQNLVALTLWKETNDDC